MLLTSLFVLPAGWWSALTAAGRRSMNRSGHVLVTWWALFIIMQCVLVVLCDLSSSTSPAAPVTLSVLSYVQWCMLWSSLLAFATHISRGAPLDEPSQHHEGKSVAVALSGWLPWRCFRDARRATTMPVRPRVPLGPKVVG